MNRTFISGWKNVSKPYFNLLALSSKEIFAESSPGNPPPTSNNEKL